MPLTVVLVGNPGVGKSLIFNHLTGVGVEIGNYPGSSVELFSGRSCLGGEPIEVIDLPGIYSLDDGAETEALVRRVIGNDEVTAVVAVLDATRLERNLYLLIQVAEYGRPMVAVVNMVDLASRRGIAVDTERLSALLGIPVLATAAAIGQGIDRILPTAVREARPATVEVPYDHHVEAAVRSLERTFGVDRRTALQALQGLGNDPELLESAAALGEEIERRHRMSAGQIITTNRHNHAGAIASEVVRSSGAGVGAALDRLFTRTVPGVPILVGVLTAMLLAVFLVGGVLEEYIVEAFDIVLLRPIAALEIHPLGKEVLQAIGLALQSGFGIAFPYIFTFYILLALLEDSGYMSRAAFLADRTMHRIGLHGEAIIPLVLGFGCNVPAVMGIRLLATRRERIIASFLITMVPCSARTVVISGIVASFVSLAAALSIYAVVLLLIGLSGLVLSRVTPGPQLGMVLEMPVLRLPKPKMVLLKSWLRIREFLAIAMPLLLASSVVLGLLGYFGAIAAFQAGFAPVSEGLLGLPDYASTALLFGILRKEMAFETLVVLAGTAALDTVMTGVQLYTFAIVSTLFVPCISTIAVLRQEIGTWIAAAITLYTVALGIAIGALVHLLAG
ncbi:MAG TPA: ferrous iron transport protein B [Methanoregulaceae archaeon]|nr:ferrous iron transport protein B [Methanoregulaceae archaeon]HQJ87572.1 ferrous iron transport protein B [Methanoregulaceae archaeon]